MLELKAKPRIELGRKVNALRRAGFVPAVLYGDGVESQPIAIPQKDFEKAWREAGESTLVKLQIEGGKEYNVLIHEITNDPVRDVPVHADFYAVRMDKKLQTNVPVVFVGESPAIKNDGGILVKVAHELEVEALPADLPHELIADISKITALNGKLFVSDIALPKGVTIPGDHHGVVAIVEAPRTEEELKSLEEAQVAAAPIEVKTEQEVKREAKAVENTEEPAA